jgi:hypothetical protein
VNADLRAPPQVKAQSWMEAARNLRMQVADDACVPRRSFGESGHVSPWPRRSVGEGGRLGS